MTCGIYKITNKINGKIYIGQSINIEQRWLKHKFKYEDPKGYFHKAVRKYGTESFIFEIVVECPKEHLNLFEIVFIRELNTMNPNGYNLTTGGTNGCSMSEQTKQKLRDSHIGHVPSAETLKRRSESMKGKNVGSENGMYGKVSPMKGKTHTEEAKKKMAVRAIQCTYNGITYESYRSAAKSLGLTVRVFMRKFRDENNS